MAQQMAAVAVPAAGGSNEDWKAQLRLPARDTRIRTAVSFYAFFPLLLLRPLLLSDPRCFPASLLGSGVHCSPLRGLSPSA